MIRRALPVFERDALVFKNELIGEVITTIAMPLTFLLIFGWGLGSYVGEIQGVPYIFFVVPGLVTMAAVMSAFDDGAWGMWFHRMVQGTINEYRVNPMTTRDIVIGKILSGFFKSTFKGIVTGLVLVVFAGFRPSLLHIFLFGLFLLPASATFSCLGTICGTLIDTPEMLGRFEGILIMPLIFLSGAFFPVSSYPPGVQAIMRFVPTTAMLDGSRETLLHGTVSPLYVAVVVASALISFLGAVEVFDRRLSD